MSRLYPAQYCLTSAESWPEAPFISFYFNIMSTPNHSEQNIFSPRPVTIRTPSIVGIQRVQKEVNAMNCSQKTIFSNLINSDFPSRKIWAVGAETGWGNNPRAKEVNWFDSVVFWYTEQSKLILRVSRSLGDSRGTVVARFTVGQHDQVEWSILHLGHVSYQNSYIYIRSSVALQCIIVP